MAGKGKQIAGKAPVAKRKLDVSEKSDGRKRRNPGVLQFFDVAADVDDDDEQEDSDEDDFAQEFMEEDNVNNKEKSQPGKVPFAFPFVPKEEELSDGELEILLEERYKPGSKYVVYADEVNKATGSGEKDSLTDSKEDPIIWRVKCTVGRERRLVFCLMQKFADLQSLGNGLKTASAFAPDHVKGFIYIEADRELDVLEACKGINTIYCSRITQVPKNEVAHLFSVRNTTIEVLPGTWVRVKMGKYRGDLAQVVAFDGARKSVTVKIIPRIDLQALAQKLAGGGAVKEMATPAARVISSRDLEKFRPHIIFKRDRQTGKVFETLDGLMLKDGYLYKKVSIESISYVDVVPTADELLKFKPSKKDSSDDVEWLSHLYGEQRKKRLSECSRGTTKDLEGTSGTKKGNSFQLHDLVCFGPNDFGVIICVESDGFQILKYHEVEGAEVLNVELHEIQSISFEKKFTTVDHQMKATTIKDTVRVLDGPFKGRQGVVKYICKGTIFIFDESQLENGGFFCAKSQLCENISHSENVQQGSNGDVFGQSDIFGAQGFEDSTSSPKSPLSSKRPWQERENNSDFNNRRQGDRDGEFSVGQTVRIRVGPLKGHLCRIISIYRSGLTVKIDSQTKVMSVKREHLSEAGVRKQIGGFGTRGEASGAPSEGNGWNSDPFSTGRSSWPDFSSSDFLPDSLVGTDASEKDKGDDPWGSKESIKQPTTSWGDAGFTGDLGKGKEEGDDPWGSRTASKNSTDSWGNAAGWGKDARKDDKEGGDPWGSKAIPEKPMNSWDNAVGFGEDSGKGKVEGNDPLGSDISKKAADSWGNALGSGEDHKKEGGDCPWESKATTSKNSVDGWGDASGSGKEGGAEPWGSKLKTSQNDAGSWGDAADFREDPARGKSKEEGADPWGTKPTSKKSTDTWGNAVGSEDHDKGGREDPWESTVKTPQTATESWGNAVGFGQDPAKGQNKEEGDGPWGSNTTGKKSRDSWGSAGGIRENSEKGKEEGDDPWGSKSWGSAEGFKADGKTDGDDPWQSKTTSKKVTNSWGTEPGICEDSGKGNGEVKGAGRNNEKAWGSPTVVQKTDRWGSGNDTHLGQEDSWSKATQSWNNSGKNKQDWTQSEKTEKSSSAWKSGADDTGAKTSSDWGSGSNWNTPKDTCENQSSAWTSGGNNSSGWGSGSNTNTWGGKSFGVDRGSDNDGESSHYSSRGRGFGRGGRSGSNRGGFARGGDDGAGESSDFPNRGRGFGRGGSSNRGGFGNRGRGRRDQNGDWSNGKPDGDSQSFGWGQSGRDDTGDQGGGWGGSSTSNRGGFGNRGRGRSSDWSNGKPDGGWGQSGKEDTGDQGGGWGGSSTSNRGGFGNRGRGRSGNWSNGKRDGDSQSFGWGQSGKDDTGDQGGGWGGSSTSNRGGFGNRGRGRSGDWGNGKRDGDGQSFGWGQSGRDDTGDQGGGWGGSSTSNRGGFGSRGRGRSGDWSNGKRDGDSQSFGWGQSGKDDTGDQGGGWGGSSTSNRGGFGNRGRGRRGGKPQGEGQSFGWSNGSGAGSGGWGNRDGETNSAGGWDKSTGENGETGGRGGGQAEDAWGKVAVSSWGNSDGEQGGGWGKGVDKTSNSEGGAKAVDPWGKTAASSWNNSAAKEGGGWGNQVNKTSNSEGGFGGSKGETSARDRGQAEDAWGKAPASSWGNGAGGQGGGWGDRVDKTSNSKDGWDNSTGAKGETGESGGGQAADAWEKAAASSWGAGPSGSGEKGGW